MQQEVSLVLLILTTAQQLMCRKEALIPGMLCLPVGGSHDQQNLELCIDYLIFIATGKVKEDDTELQ